MIRSVTIGVPFGRLSPADAGDVLSRTLGAARAHFRSSGFECRTVRLTLPPAGADFELEGALSARVALAERLCNDHGLRWFCLPIDYVEPGSASLRSVGAVRLLQGHPRMFLNFMLAAGRTIAADQAMTVGRDILRISRLSNNGFDNFRVGTSFNCPPNAPFFPFSHHAGDEPAFSLALEVTPLALEAARLSQGDLQTTRATFTISLAALLTRVEEAACGIAREAGVAYRGADASLAPLPDGQTSVAEVIERMMSNSIGGHGTLMATALLTDGIRSAFQMSGATPAGFNGVMFSVLEDRGLADALGRRQVSLDGLTSFASVCGCGLDMIPVPGTVFPDEIAAVLLDIAALSSALGKPLGVRLLPIPGRAENETTCFNQDFLCDGRILPLRANPLHVTNTVGKLLIRSTVGEIHQGGR